MVKKDICIITTNNLKYCPYVKLYSDILDDLNVSYDIVIWDKYDLHEDVTYSYHGKKNDGKKIRTFFQYIGFGRFITNILAHNKYKKLIVCNPAPLLFVRRKVLDKYDGNFIWDIRDDTPIRKYFKHTFTRICKMASCIVTSSKEYERWIGRETVLSHNVSRAMIDKYYDYEPTALTHSVARLINAGKMIEQEENIRVLNILGNKPEYRFIYYGTAVPGRVILEDYCKSNSIKNVDFHGSYDKNEIIDIYRREGNAVNILRSETPVNRDALPNKLYEAVIAGLPIVVYRHNTAVSTYVEEFNLGVILDNDNVEMISTKLKSFDYGQYAMNRRRFLIQIKNDISLFESTVSDFVAESEQS